MKPRPFAFAAERLSGQMVIPNFFPWTRTAPAVFWLAGFLLLLAAPLGLADTLPVPQPVEVTVRPITEFLPGQSEETMFGPFEFIGGLEMTGASSNFGGFSAFRFLNAGYDFIGVADTGFWFFGSIRRDADGRPAGIENFRMERMIYAKDQPASEKRYADAEGLAIKDGIATVAFEREHRIAQFRIEPGAMKGPLRTLDFLVPRRELRQNRGFETVAHSRADGPLKGAIVIISEKSLDREGNIFGAILDGPRKGIFTVRRSEGFDISDGTFLPDGDLLLLERSYTFMRGLRLRLRRIAEADIIKGAVLDGPVLMQADMKHQIDNMEGIDAWTRADGQVMVSLISDDNGSLFQRNLYLEFALHQN